MIGQLKKCKLISEQEDGELFKSWQEKMSLQDQTISHTPHISDAKLMQKINDSFNQENGSKPDTLRSNLTSPNLSLKSQAKTKTKFFQL